MSSPKKKRSFFDLFRDVYYYNEDGLIDRVEKLKSELIDTYSEIKSQEKEDLLAAAERVESEETVEKLYILAEHAEKQVEQTKSELNSSEEYLQSVADVIGRK